MFEQKTLLILMTLLQQPSVSLYELSVKTKFSIAELRAELANLNAYFYSKSLPGLTVTDKGYRLSESVFLQAEQMMQELREEHLYLEQDERMYMIYLYTFCRREFVSNQHYQELLQVSKNTALADIKILREKMKDFELKVTYTRAEGYAIQGAEKDKHRLSLYAISQLLKRPVGVWALHHVLDAWDYTLNVGELADCVEEYTLAFQLTPIQNRLEECLYLIVYILYRYARVSSFVQDSDDGYLEPFQDLIMIIIQRFSRSFPLESLLTKNEKTYLARILLGCFEGDRADDSYFELLTRAVVDKMEEISLLIFEDRQKLEAGLKRHLIPAYFRLKYRLYSSNSYTEQVKEDYTDLFALVQKALEPLEKEIGVPIPDAEISYFVVHFGGYLQKKSQQSLSYRAVILCPNGVSSSLILKETFGLVILN